MKWLPSQLESLTRYKVVTSQNLTSSDLLVLCEGRTTSNITLNYFQFPKPETEATPNLPETQPMILFHIRITSDIGRTTGIKLHYSCVMMMMTMMTMMMMTMTITMTMTMTTMMMMMIIHHIH